MFNGMKLTVDTVFVSELAIHPASNAAFECFMEMLWELVEDFLIERKMTSENPIITARPLVIADSDGNDSIIMHFGMYDRMLQELEWAEVEHDDSEGDFQESPYTVLRVENELSDSQIELISWLYVIDIFDDFNEYIDPEIPYSFQIHYLVEQSHELLADILRHRPTSNFAKFWLDGMVPESADCLQ
ncbi:MAG: hypothetical protein ABJV04_19765 [Aliiglaciecola sp.]|uniref:hypothetical protein n=1 Tax=Aliiglaciecola sp. TaxID=1872441 RepID=UPI0032989F88